MFVSGLPHALRCSCRERIVSLLLRLHHWVMARHSTAGHSPLPHSAPLGHGTSPYRRPLSTAPLCTTGSWHVTVPQATLHCPTLHHWVMARHRTAGHSPLPHSAPLGHGTSPYRRPLSTAPNCPRRPSAAPRAGTWTAVVARLHTAPCDPHCGHASRLTADTPLFASILHMVRADRILRYFAPA